MGGILVFIQHNEGRVARASLEALKGGQDLSRAQDRALIMVLFGLDAPPAEIAAAQADEILLAPAAELRQYSAEYHVAAMAAIVAAEQPALLVAAHTYQARDWLPRLSARLDRPLVSDCTGYTIKQADPPPREGPGITWVRPVFQGKISAEVRTTPGLTLVSFQAGAFRSDALAQGAPAVRTHPIDLSHIRPRVQPGERFQEAKGSVDLTRAERIVCVGRGIGKEENMALVRELAQVLNGEVGASRPVVDSGWLEHDRQIGSSGQNVSPKLYLGLGVSGAIQHQVGMKNSDCIVAINKDSHAPIFEIADYGIVGDIFAVVPKLIQTIREKNRGAAESG